MIPNGLLEFWILSALFLLGEGRGARIYFPDVEGYQQFGLTNCMAVRSEWDNF